MRHVLLEQWSRRSSYLHRRDPRVKIVSLLVLLIAIGITNRHFELAAPIFLAMMIAATLCARLPVFAVLRRAAVVLPFSLTFTIASWISGDPHRAILLMEKSYLSAWATVLLVATTSLPQLLRGLEMLGVPAFLLMVAQFLYRYLFVIADQAHRMRSAARCRGGAGFQAAARAAGVLFARSYERAGNIHRAMISRGFQGHLPLLSQPRIGAADMAFACLACVSSVAAALLART